MIQFKKILKILDEHQVDFVLIGGHIAELEELLKLKKEAKNQSALASKQDQEKDSVCEDDLDLGDWKN